MKYIILTLCFILSLLVANGIAISTHDYFYDIKMKECDAIQGSEYEVSTEDVSRCYKIKVNKFWQYDLGYYTIPNTMVIFLFMAIFLMIQINYMAADIGRF